MSDHLWWKQPLRVIQDNLQVMDTPKMDPAKIAQETKDMHANALVMNVGGIYAWYPSQIPFHHINEYLPENYDLLQRLIEECHKRDLKFIARFDFSKTDDYVSQLHPEWFIRNPDGSRRSYGAERPGNWSILYLTCANAGYRNEEVAIPVLEEVLDHYAIDGIFLNAPGYDYCTCQACQDKYLSIYGKPLPVRSTADSLEETYGGVQAPEEMDSSFPGICYRDNIGKLYQAVKRKSPDMPLILYYNPHQPENLTDRLQTADLLCTEAQDVLSRKWSDIPPMWYPTFNMKYGRTQPKGNPQPFGIIHSCPGMDWRHTGLPQAEYRSWLRQIPAAGGTIWHSVTGFNDTITDKRIIQTVSEVNAEIEKIQPDMAGAEEKSDVLLLWNRSASHGWIQLFINTQTQFDLCEPHQIEETLLFHYPIVVLPDEYPLNDSIISVLRNYVQQGGNLVMEGTTKKQLGPFSDLLGISDSIHTSEALTASYWQFEEAGRIIQKSLEDTPILPHRGVTAFTRALPGTKVLATLIPPFAPLNSVGAPPERASMLVKHTDIPLCTLNEYKKGKAIMLSFSLSKLADKHRLSEFFYIWNNVADLLLGSQRTLQMKMVQGIIANTYQKEDRILVHLVNAIGSRPLMNNFPYYDFDVTVPLPKGKQVVDVTGVLEDAPFTCSVHENLVTIHVKKLTLWEMFRISIQ